MFDRTVIHMFSHERYTAAHEGAAVLDRTPRGRVTLNGSDRRTYLQGLLTNDIAALTAGTGCYAALLTPQGRMISDMRVFELGDSILLDVPDMVAGRVAAHLTEFVFSEDVAIQDVSATLAHLVLLGSASADALNAGDPGGCDADSVRRLRPFESRRCRLGGVETIVAGNDEFGVPGFDLFVPAAQKAAIVTALTKAGVTPIDDEVAEALRIEAGTPQFGADMNENTIPLEAGIEGRAISDTKGCYVGQEVIIRVLHRGHGRVARRLVGLMFPPEGQPPARGERLHAGGRHIGAVTSATWSPGLGRPIALGYVLRDFTTPGISVEVGDAELQTATVASLPFVVQRDSSSMRS